MIFMNIRNLKSIMNLLIDIDIDIDIILYILIYFDTFL